MPLLSQWINKKGTFVRQKLLFCCERAVKKCVNVGKNSEKVCDFVLLSTRQIGIGLYYMLFNTVPICIVIQ